MNHARKTLLLFLIGISALTAIACAAEEFVVQTVVVERHVEVPVEVIREVEVERLVPQRVVQTVVVEKRVEVPRDVVVEREVPVVQTVVVEREVEVERQVVVEVEKLVEKELQVPPVLTVVVEREVEIQGESVVVSRNTVPATPAPAATSAPARSSQPSATTFRDYRRNPAVSTYEDAVSTFSLDTDRTSYRLALNWVSQGLDVDPDSVRAEEWVNSFDYGYAPPSRDDEFGIDTEVFRHPLDHGLHIARLGFQAPELDARAKPVNVTLVLDASGSMADGNRVGVARAAAHSIRESLTQQDRMAVVHFSSHVTHRLPHLEPDHPEVLSSIRGLRPNDSTNVQAGLNQGVKFADEARRRNPEAVNYIILMSDGVANVDATDPFAILESAGDHDPFNPLRLITIGVGVSNYNDHLLEQLAQHGNGWYRYLDTEGQAKSTFERDNWLRISTPFADQTRAQVTWDPSSVAEWRIVGYENRVTDDAAFTQNRKEFAEIPSGAATTVLYELSLTDAVDQRRASTARLGDIEVRWVDPNTGQSREQYGSVSGHWREEFEAAHDPMLKLGTIVALAADRYSALPQPFGDGYGDIGRDLSELNRRLRVLEPSLGNVTAYQDFSMMLDQMARYAPQLPPRIANSGYSP